jgi:hypothetical protein
MTFQRRVLNWLMTCFSMEVCRGGTERNHRFLEEALELVQSLGCTASEAHQLVDYVFGRPVGEPFQELGGVMVTLSALASCHDMDFEEAGETGAGLGQRSTPSALSRPRNRNTRRCPDHARPTVGIPSARCRAIERRSTSGTRSGRA